MKKRMFKAALLFWLVFLLLSVPSFAYGEAGEDYYEDFSESVPDGVDGEKLSEIGIDSLLGELFEAVGEGLGNAIPIFFSVFGIALMSALAESANPIIDSTFAPNISAGVGAVSSLFIFSSLMPVISSAEKSLGELSVFFSGLIPIASGILLSSGNVNSSAAQAMNMNITLAVVSAAMPRLLLPLCFALFALALLGSLDGGGISSLSKSIKGLYMWILGIGTTVIIAAMSMQSVISGARDSAYLRAAKYAASGMIPIVGSTVSGAMNTLAGGLSYIKSTVGASAVAVIVLLSLAPLVKLLLIRLSFSVSISFLEFVSAPIGQRMLSAFRGALDALTALYASVSVIYISEMVIFLKSGVSVFG